MSGNGRAIPSSTQTTEHAGSTDKTRAWQERLPRYASPRSPPPSFLPSHSHNPPTSSPTTLTRPCSYPSPSLLLLLQTNEPALRIPARHWGLHYRLSSRSFRVWGCLLVCALRLPFPVVVWWRGCGCLCGWVRGPSLPRGGGRARRVALGPRAQQARYSRQKVGRYTSVCQKGVVVVGAWW